MPKPPKLPRTIWILGWASLCTDISSEMIHAVLPLFLVTQLGGNGLIVGLIEGLAEAVVALCKPLSGYLSDRMRMRKPLIVGGYALSALSKPLFALAASPVLVLAARLSDRLGKGVRGAPRDALVADLTSPESRGAAFGLRQSLDSVGAVLGPLLASVLLLVFVSNYRLVFWLAVIPGLLSVILLWFGLPAEKPRSGDSTAPAKVFVSSLPQQFWWLLAVSAVFALGNSSDAFILLKAKLVGFDLPGIPLLLVVMNLAYSATAYPAGRLADKLSRKLILLAAFGLYAFIYAGLALAVYAWQMWVLMCLYGIYLGFSQGVLLALVADYVDAGRRATAYGVINLVSGLGLLPASLMAGWLWQQISPAACFALGVLGAVTAGLVLLLAPLPKSRE